MHLLPFLLAFHTIVLFHMIHQLPRLPATEQQSCCLFYVARCTFACCATIWENHKNKQSIRAINL